MKTRKWVGLLICLFDGLGLAGFFLNIFYHGRAVAGPSKSVGAIGEFILNLTQWLFWYRGYVAAVALLVCLVMIAVNPREFFRERPSFYALVLTVGTLLSSVIIT